MLGAGIDDLDLLALELELDQVLGLGEEEILGAAHGVERVRQLHALLPGLVARLTGSVVGGDVERLLGLDGGKQLLDLGNGKLLHHFFPPLYTMLGSTSSKVKLVSGARLSVSSPA